jgi:hypothetical protein
VQQVQADYGIPVFAVATLAHLIGFIQQQAAGGVVAGGIPGLESGGVQELLERVKEYRAVYGAPGPA